MSETPLKGFTKYQTIGYEDRNSKGLASTAYRLTQRKSNSVLANPESLLSTTIPNINIEQNLSLPKINKKKKEKKQGTFLESWLDQALGAPDPFAQQKPQDEQRIEGNVLKTLKKFQLDKRHLQSQNIPAQKVQKLYRNLYIYSHGVNKIFEQLIELTKQKQNSELTGNFWKAYTKLLESCTSYQTIFQKVEKDHLQTIERLKRNIETKAEAFEEQKKQLQTKLKKSEKAVEEKENQYNNLKTEYDVLKNTLDLTDEAFNQEVNLRLKFEEKINAVYTSYEELKNKYTKVVEEMGIKNLDIVDRDNKEDELKGKLLIERTKVEELMFLLKAQRDKVKERQTEIVIKNQEMEDIKATLLAKSSEEDNTHDKMEEYISKMKALKTKLIEIENVVAGQKITIREQEEHMKKMSKSLEEYKQHNNEIYEKYAGSGKKIVVLQSQIEMNNLKLTELQKSTMQKSVEITDLNRELQHVKNQRDTLRHELNISTKNLKDTKDTMTKNNVILEDMKAVKDKYERINEFLKESVKDLETSNNTMSQDLSLKTEELEGMKLLLENRNKSLVQMEKQLEQEKEIGKSKITALNSVIAKKEALALEYQKKKQETEKEVSDTKIMLKMTEDKVIHLESDKIKLEVQLSSKTKVLKQLEQILTKENEKYKELNLKLQGELKEKSGISSKLMNAEFVLKTKNDEDRIEVMTLTNLLNEYKMKILEKAQYVHPMLFEEALETARRCFDNEEKFKRESMRNKARSAEITGKYERLEELAKELNGKIANLETKNGSLTQQRLKLLEKVKKLQETVKSTSGLYEKEQKTSKGYKDELEASRNAEKQLKQKNKGLEDTATNLKIKIEQMIQEAKKKSRSETRQVKREVKKMLVDQQAQTEALQQEKQIKQAQPQIQKVDQQAQTQIQQQNLEKAQEVMTSIYKETKQEQPIKKQQVPQKKVESKDFRKALKLTYMRR